LQPGPALRHVLAAGTLDAYEIDLAADQYLHFHVEQLGVDVYVDVRAPGRRRLFHADTRSGATGPEDVHLVADRPGRYRLEVGAAKPGGHGPYLARIAALRPARLADRNRAAAQQAAREAWALTPDGKSFWQAAADYEKALRLWEEVGDRQSQIDALNSLGELYFQHGRSRDAIAVCRRYLALSRALGRPRDIALSSHLLGRAYGRVGDFPHAHSAYQDALSVWRTLREPSSEISTLICLGELDEINGQSRQALECFRQGADLAHRIQDTRSEVNALNGVGWVYSSLGDLVRGRRSHERALKVLRSKPDHPLEAVTLTQLAGIYLQADQPQQALPLLRAALACTRDPALASERAVTLSMLGRSLQGRHDDRQAAVVYEQALAIFVAQGNTAAEVMARINLGWSYAQLRQSERALEHYLEALAQARQLGDRAAEALALLGLGTGERDRGNPIAALGYGQQGLAIVESLRAEAVRPDLQASYLARHESFYGLLIGALMEQNRQQPRRDLDRQAAELSERSRTQRLLDALREGRERHASLLSAGNHALLSRWSELTAQIDVQDRARRRLAAPEAERASAEAELADLLDRLNDLEERIRLSARGPAARAAEARVPAQPATAELQRALLAPDTVLLEYYLGEPRSFLFEMSSDGGLRSFELPGRSRLEGQILPLYRSLAAGGGEAGREPPAAGARDAAPASSAWERDALALSRTLLGQVIGDLDGKRLLIATSGALQYLPFAALPDPAGREGPLARWHEIVYIPSLAVLGELRRRSAGRRPPPGQLAILADPVFGPSDPRLQGITAAGPAAAGDELPRLTWAGDEAGAIRDLLPPAQVLLLQGFDATRDLVMSGALARYRRLHFATHGTLRLDPSDPFDLPAIVLSLFDRQGRERNGYLRTHDLSHLELPADLVVLSACDTALGPELAGEGMFGLPQAFLTAGAERVMVSLWKVGDRATAELMQRFYHHLLAEGLRAGEALRRAQLEMQQQRRWRDPSHWAGFVLLGDWR
jgi:tetratricopeptide (TPR) repeat protein